MLAIKQQEQLVESVPWLARTLRVRTPYVDLLNLIQTQLLKRRQAAGGDRDVSLDQALRRTIQAIAAGLRNTG